MAEERNLIHEMIAQIADGITADILAKISSELSRRMSEALSVCWTEAVAADRLGCSPQTLARIRKNKEIDFCRNPAGRPVYMEHHLTDFLLRNEIRTGKQNKKAA